MKKNLRNDLFVISKLINDKEKILDVGCGSGNLLDFLLKKKKADCRGIEISQSGVNECVKKGLSVIQGDANYDLDDYPDNAFSTVILSQTIQAMIFPDAVIVVSISDIVPQTIKNKIRKPKEKTDIFTDFGTPAALIRSISSSNSSKSSFIIFFLNLLCFASSL